MKVAFYQFNVQKDDKESNLLKVRKKLEGTDIELVVLPEYFSTGIIKKTRNAVLNQAEKVPDGYTCSRLQEIAKENNCFLIGSLIEREGEYLFNTAVVIGPGGFLGKQRKVHLCDFEQNFLERGKEFNIFNINNVKMGILICYDCWFPEISRILMFNGVQVICHPCNFSNSLSFDFAKIRAIESTSYLISCNQAAMTKVKKDYINYIGGSRIYDYKGGMISLAGKNEVLQSTVIDPQKSIKKEYEDCQDVLSQLKIYKNNYNKYF